MLRLTTSKLALPAMAAGRRTFAVSALRMADGDTGGIRPGMGQPDAFQKREKAAEDYAIREREKEKLMDLKKKLQEQQAHLKKLSDHIDEITKEQGGEHN